MLQLYPWHTASWQKLASQRAYIPHAMLITSPPDIGVENFANYFAASLLCHNVQQGNLQHAISNQTPTPTTTLAPCAACPSCHLARNSPDYHLVKPEKVNSAIKVDQIRELVAFTNQTRHSSPSKVVVIEQAAQMNQAAQNALLKTLEEPNPEVYLLLLTATPTRLLPTIASRCQRFTLPTPDAAIATQWLSVQPQLAGHPQEALASMATAPLLAVAWAESGFLAGKEELSKAWLGLRENRSACPSKLATEFLKWPVLDGYRCLLAWLSDCITLVQTHDTAELRYSGIPKELLHQCCSGISLAGLYELLDLTRESYRLALHQANINQQLSFEVLLGRWQTL